MNSAVQHQWNPIQFIEERKDSSWVNGPGLIFYLINAIALWSRDSLAGIMQDPDLTGIVVSAAGIVLTAVIFRVIWVGMIFLSGLLLWRGTASRRNIDTAVAISFVPLVIPILYHIVCYFYQWQIFDAVYYASWGLSLCIMVAGIARVQKFSLVKSASTLGIPILILLGLQQLSVLMS